MKVSDYLVDFLIEKGVTDIFGYPGGMVTHLMDSLGKKREWISTHISYHEQAAAFAACGFAQASGQLGVAFATSGPGATNLITGIGNAFFDSIPTLFITGQVNTFESKNGTSLRQKGFQETNIVEMVRGITKAAYYVDEANSFSKILNEAYDIAISGRKGPVLIDIPMNVFREEIDILDDCSKNDIKKLTSESDKIQFIETLTTLLNNSQRPCLLIGNGIKIDRKVQAVRDVLEKCQIPVVSSMLAVDVLSNSNENDVFFGFIGAYGSRTANFVVAKADLMICLGSRLDVRQVGGNREQFAPNSQILRVDIDPAELGNKIREDDKSFIIELDVAIYALKKVFEETSRDYSAWMKVCHEIKSKLDRIDEKEPNRYITAISNVVPDEFSIVADVGQHMVWVAQSFIIRPTQRIFFSGGMGSMGYALPASIGIYYATKKPVICFAGDGGIQMNIQEFQFIAREHLPVKIVVLNNQSLGMIRHFQEMYFNSNFYYTVRNEGYSVPDLKKIANAYGFKGTRIISVDEIKDIDFHNPEPELIEIALSENTYVFPKLEFGKPNQDQDPLLDRATYTYLMGL